MKKLLQTSSTKGEKLFSLFAIMLLLFIGSCKKETQNENLVKVKSILSTNSPDYLSRLNEIKNFFYLKNLNKKLKANIDERLVWSPDWANPKSQVINDSVSYVFYRLIGRVKENGNWIEAKEMNGASYLMVKNENEFYKAFYSGSQSTGDQPRDSAQFETKNFTGKMLLSNLETGKNFLIDYVNGKASESYQKKQFLAINKLSSAGSPATIAYWERQCRTEMRECTYVSSGSAQCNGGYPFFEIIYSEGCNQPSSVCGMTFWLSDFVYRDICSYIWYPDPPTEPGDGGGGDEPAITNSDLSNATVFDDGKPKIADIKKYTNCFNDGKTAQSYTMTIYADQPVAGQSDWFKILPPGVVTNNGFNVPTGIVWQTPSGDFFDVGHTFVTFEKNNTDGTNVRQTLGFYPKGSNFGSQGAFEDNGYHEADVKYTINVTKTQFEAGLLKVETDFATKNYRLDNLNGTEYNCTDAAISWMNAAGANFGNSSSGLFKNTPGNFGQVLRNMPGAYSNPSSGIPSKGPCN